MYNTEKKSLKAFSENANRNTATGKLIASSEMQGLEDCELIGEDVNAFIARFRKLYLSGKMMKFRDWFKELEHLIDALD